MKVKIGADILMRKQGEGVIAVDLAELRRLREQDSRKGEALPLGPPSVLIVDDELRIVVDVDKSGSVATVAVYGPGELDQALVEFTRETEGAAKEMAVQG